VRRIHSNRSRETARWLRTESAEQRRRRRGILAVQDALAPRRTRWIAQFLERIQSRGFHVNGAECRKVRPEEIPSQPRRALRVVS
jgi:hypothetical protein